MGTSSGVDSKDGGEPDNSDMKDDEKVNIIDWERNLYIWGYYLI